jgi:ArsR family transcriptional regulator
MATRTKDPAQQLALLQALAEPTRLRIVDLLRSGERCVCELTEALDAAQPRLSFHLKVLKDAGLVEDRREGRWIYYSLRRELCEELAEFLTASAPVWGRSGGECC